MTIYGPSQPRHSSSASVAEKAQARRELLERIRRQRIQNARKLREKVLRVAKTDPEVW